MWKKAWLTAAFLLVVLSLPRWSLAQQRQATPHSGLTTLQADAAAQTAVDEGWPMAGANLERTSWVPEEITTGKKLIWYRKVDPYISQKVQLVASNDRLFVSTSAGLLALNAATGAELWSYPTEHPLGHSPTVAGGVVYVGGMDRRMHAVNAANGQRIWTFLADAGWHTNPLVVNNLVLAGNRDGYFYALHATGPNAGKLAWKYKTDGPILYSAAYKDNVVFFASNDSHAYALNSLNGALVWKSDKLPGAGFYSWWPVVWRDRVIFSAANNYRVSTLPGPGSKLVKIELQELFPGYDTPPYHDLIGPIGNQPGDWAPGTVTINVQTVMNYFQQKPWRRSVLVLDRFTGQEQEIAPILWAGTHSGSRYPPVVGSDDVLYQQTVYIDDPSIAGGQIVGWQPGVPHISVISSDWGASDEPHAASAGGDLVYWNLCCDRQSGAIDITQPNTNFQDRVNAGVRPPTGNMDTNREWLYFNYNLTQQAPNYETQFFNPEPQHHKVYANFGGPNGVYGFHADTNAPVPYKGRVYVHRSNAIMAFGTTAAAPVQLPMATIPATNESAGVDPLTLQNRLEEEIQKILDAGHLRPGYMSHGIFDLKGQSECADDYVDYFHQPAETLYTLLLALPHLPAGMQQDVRAYLQAEFNAYPPHDVNHIGWADGAPRQIFDLPPEVESARATYQPKSKNPAFVWNVNPFTFYALWLYAEEFGGAAAIYNASERELDAAPPDAVLLDMPFVHNAFIAGYHGFLELEALAGKPESTDIRNELNRLLALRGSTFSADSAYASQLSYCRTLNVASNFMYMTPELVAYLHSNAFAEVTAAMAEYEKIAPYWFVSFATEGFAENAVTLLSDAHALFVMKKLFFNTPSAQLREFLDVPAFAVGDLYYIHKLILTLEQAAFDANVSYHYMPLAAAK